MAEEEKYNSSYYGPQMDNAFAAGLAVRGTAGLIKSDGAGNVSAAVAGTDYQAPITASASGPIATFERITGGMPVNSLVVDINAVQAGSGDPSPSNVRSINGWTGAEITRAGKNLCPPAVIGRSFDNNTGADIESAAQAATARIRVDFSKHNYHLRNTAPVNSMIFGWDADGNYVARTGGALNTEYTFNHTSFTNSGTGGTGDKASIVWIAVKFYQATGQNIGDITGKELQIEVGDAFTSYEPPAVVYPVSFGAAGTVYGGRLNVTTGELTVTHERVDMGTLGWSYNSSGTYFAATVSDKAIGNMNLIADCYKTTTALNTASMANNEIKGRATGPEIYLKDSRYTDAASLKTALSGHYLVYELDEPLTYQLTPTEVTTLLGENNIWADTGDVEVTFGEDIKKYVDSLVLGAIGGSY